MEAARPRALDSLHAFQAQLLHAVGRAIIATDLDGRVTFWNRAAERLYGWSAGEALGRGIDELVLTPETAKLGEQVMAEVLAGRTWSGEFVVRRKDGSTFPAHVTDTPVVDAAGRTVGIVGVSFDLTAEKGAADALRATQRRVEWLADATPDVLWEWEPASGRVWRSTDLAARLGVDDAGIDVWTHHIHPEDRERVVTSLHGALKAGATAWSEEYRFARGDGTFADVLDRARIVRGPLGEAERVLGIMIDVSERLAAQRELEATRRTLAQAEKLSALGMLVSGIAHELKTPLAYIATNVHLARSRLDAAADDGLSAAQARDAILAHFDEAAHGVDRINRLVLELRRFTRARAPGYRRAPLDHSVRAGIDLFRLTAKGRADVAADLQPTPGVLVDDEQLQQVVINLLDNAADAAPGSVIHVEVALAPEGARLRVRDDGAGIPEAVRARMFEAFFTTKQHGTGLGLAIVERIVRSHRGRIAIENGPARGTTFEIVLPRA